MIVTALSSADSFSAEAKFDKLNDVDFFSYIVEVDKSEIQRPAEKQETQVQTVDLNQELRAVIAVSKRPCPLCYLLATMMWPVKDVDGVVLQECVLPGSLQDWMSSTTNSSSLRWGEGSGREVGPGTFHHCPNSHR